MARNYSRTLVMFKPAPGKQSLELVPDLATDLGKSSDGGKTWTYTIQKGLKMEDGTPITTKDDRLRRLAHLRHRGAEARPAVLRDAAELAEGLQGSLQGSRRTPTSPRRSRPRTTPRSSSTSSSRSPSSTTSPRCRRRHRCRRPRTPAASTRRTRSPRVPTCGRATPTSTAAAPWSATPTGTPRPTPTARRSRTRSTSSSGCRPTTWTTRSSPVTRTSTSPAPACSRRRSPRCSSRRPSRPGRTTRSAGSSGSRGSSSNVKPFDNIDCRKAVMYAMSPTLLPERLRRQVRRRRARQHRAAPDDPRLQEVRPLRSDHAPERSGRPRPRQP